VPGRDGQHGAIGEGGVGVGEPEDDGRVVRGLDAVDGVEFALGGVVGLRIEDGLVREDHVGGGERLAVAELDAVAQPVGVRGAVVADLRQGGGEGGAQLHPRVTGEQPVEDLGVAVLAVAEQRTQRLGFVRDPDGQLVTGAARRAPVRIPAGGGGRQHRRGHRRRDRRPYATD
jgi:hypothetical protein